MTFRVPEVNLQTWAHYRASSTAPNSHPIRFLLHSSLKLGFASHSSYKTMVSYIPSPHTHGFWQGFTWWTTPHIGIMTYLLRINTKPSMALPSRHSSEPFSGLMHIDLYFYPSPLSWAPVGSSWLQDVSKWVFHRHLQLKAQNGEFPIFLFRLASLLGLKAPPPDRGCSDSSVWPASWMWLLCSLGSLFFISCIPSANRK